MADACLTLQHNGKMFFRIATAELYCMSGSFYFYLKEKQCLYKPGSVPSIQMASVIYLVHKLPHESSVLPSIAKNIRRATFKRWYTRTCSFQMAQPDDHPPAGSLLHHLLTLTYD